jgi:amidase
MNRITTQNIIHVMSKENTPAIKVKTGDKLVVETAKPGIPDEVFTKDYSVTPFPKRVLSITGPIYVEDCNPGDVLKVDIHKIDLDSAGKMWMGQWMGLLMDEVDHCFLKKVTVENGLVNFSDKIKIPIKPMIGTIGVAPAGEEIACLYPGLHGGNMDVPAVTVGNTIYIPVQVEGGLLSIGDVHAAMGAGEVLGTGIEIGSTVELVITVEKNRKLTAPYVETPLSYEFVASHADLLSACKDATKIAIAFVQKKNNCSFDEAYALVGQTGDLKIAQVVNPIFTVTMEVFKSVLVA